MARKKPRRKKTAVDYLLTILLIAAVGVFCYAGFNLVKIWLDYKKVDDDNNKIEKMVVTERDPDAEKTFSYNPADGEDSSSIIPPKEVDFERLLSINSDICGWLYVEALSDTVSLPLVHTSDNDYYLHKNYNREYSFAGTLFLDFENSPDFTDCNTIIYGHNMKNGSMFGLLKHFVTDPETIKKGKYFWIFTPKESYRYEIISAYTTGVSSETYTIFKGPGEDFEKYLAKIPGWSQLPAEYNVDPETLTVRDRIVTLSTCTGDDSTRFVVQGKLVNTIRNMESTGE